MRGAVTRLLLVLAVALAALAARAGGASAYGWPVAPFFQPHPLIGIFGEPRTVFDESFGAGGVDGPGKFSFHNGIDVAAPTATPVYPVVSGRAFLLSGTAVVVRSSRHRVFQYYHVQPAIWDGEQVVARRTILGYVLKWAQHVHFSEIDAGHITNPLLRGHIGPYTDTTKPVVSSVEFRDVTGATLDPTALRGVVDVVASAYDTPPLSPPGVTRPFPVTPAALTWSLTDALGDVVVAPHATVDFRHTLPFNRDFWLVYARGTYQNTPTFGGHVLRAAGRYLFHLAPNLLDTRLLPNGVYTLAVTASDARGNTGTLTRQFTVANDLP